MLSLTNRNSLPVLALDKDAILRFLPHSGYALYLEGITEIERGKRAVGFMGVYGCELCLQGHYEPKKILPGHILEELFNQVACVLYVHSIEPNGVDNPFFKGIPLIREHHIKYPKMVEPPCYVLAEVVLLETVEHRFGQEWKLRGRARVDGKLVASSNFKGLLLPL